MSILQDARYQLRRVFHALSAPYDFITLTQPVHEAAVASALGGMTVLGQVSVRPGDIVRMRVIGKDDLQDASLFNEFPRLQHDATWYLTTAQTQWMMKGIVKPELTLVVYHNRGRTDAVLVAQTPEDIAAQCRALEAAQAAHRARKPVRPAQKGHSPA